MSYRKRLLLINNFIQTLDYETQSRINSYVGNNYSMDDMKVLDYFGLRSQFEDYVLEYEFAA